MDDYHSVFSKRAREYHEAGVLHPDARMQERRILIGWLEAGENQVICDIPAGGGYLAEGLSKLSSPMNIICIEPVWEFVSAVPAQFMRTQMSFGKLALKDGCADRVGSLTGLHHEEHKQGFFHEIRRILKPGGIAAVADVKTGTAPAEFLNGPVDRYSSTGHKGMFLKDGEFSGYLKEAGFKDVEEKHCSYTWDLPDWKALIFYCRKLFGLSKADDDTIRSELNNHFKITEDGSGVHLPWSLLYARGVR